MQIGLPDFLPGAVTGPESLKKGLKGLARVAFESSGGAVGLDTACLLYTSYKNYYAVGSFNGYNYETFKGIVDAGVETGTPVILAFGAKYLANMTVETDVYKRQ